MAVVLFPTTVKVRIEKIDTEKPSTRIDIIKLMLSCTYEEIKDGNAK